MIVMYLFIQSLKKKNNYNHFEYTYRSELNHNSGMIGKAKLSPSLRYTCFKCPNGFIRMSVDMFSVGKNCISIIYSDIFSLMK